MTVMRIALVCVLVGVVATRAQETGKLSFSLKPVGKNVWAAIDAGTVTAPAAANAGVILGDDGVVVVDTFASPARRNSCWPRLGSSPGCQ